MGNIPYSADERDVRDLFSAYNGVQKFMISEYLIRIATNASQ